MKSIKVVVVGIWLALAAWAAGQDPSPNWFPKQQAPKTLLRAGASSYEGSILLHSIAGLAAKAVNEGRGDALVWFEVGNPDYKEWLARWLKHHPEVNVVDAGDEWQSLDRFVKKGLIKGFVLYRSDKSGGGINEWRSGMDCSVNVATNLAGVLDAAVVEESQEQTARQHGLKMLMDARSKSQDWCFDQFRSYFSRRLLFEQDPKKPNGRDLAIAQQVFTCYGSEGLSARVLQWLDPLSPLLGWNGGDEFAATDQATLYGDFQAGTDWSENLPVLMAGADKYQIPSYRRFDPRKIRWSDRRSGVSFVLTDGDNTQWYMGGFFKDNNHYWNSPARGEIPFGWSCPFDHLQQLCPEAMDNMVSTKGPNDTFIEWGGGYFYPNHFGAKRNNRWELLAAHAKQTWELMKRAHTNIVGFNLTDLDQEDAMWAYKTWAAQTDGLLAILVFRYDAYEGGAGQVWWVKDKNGIEIPVISAGYSIWNHLNGRSRAGTPAKVAREISQNQAADKRYEWVICHAWSWFRPSSSNDENAEDMDQNDVESPKQGGERGYLPAVWCADRLPGTIQVMSIDELIWRIRMQHNPEQTRKLIADWAAQ